MFNVILFQPEIPPNTGNIIRLCANTGSKLHLIKPLGFRLQDKQLLRAGLDYHEFSGMIIHENWLDCKRKLQGCRMFAVTTKGKQRYDRNVFTAGDSFLFGAESCGLPVAVLESFSAKNKLRVPMLPASRSLNLSNSVAVVVYEAWRQAGFKQGG